jgi:hypothetical protein
MTIMKKRKILFCILVICIFLLTTCASGMQQGERLSSTVHSLVADGRTDTYQLIRDRGYNYEVPDDPRWGNHHSVRHITQQFDPFLNKYVFAFSLCHNENAIDTWINSNARGRGPNSLTNYQQIDRQRNELKTDATSPEWGRARAGHQVIYRWKFKLPLGFVASSNFTHIHQLKAVGGDESQPIITLTVRSRSSGNPPAEMQLIYRYATDSSIDRNRYLMEEVLLDDFYDEWVAVEEKVVYDTANPVFEFKAVRMRDQKVLMHYVYDAVSWNMEVPFRTIRPGNNFVRPKWGVYRAILRRVDGNMVPVISPSPLRDETVLFADFEIETFFNPRPRRSEDFLSGDFDM